MKINGRTSITGIFGRPVTHTLSPAMHNAAFEKLQLNFVYIPFEIDDLGRAVSSIIPLGIKGVNITVPYKERVIKYLDKIDPLAQKTGSVNTIVNDKGILKGYTTDGKGFLEDLRQHGFNHGGKTAFILGAGGAGRAIAAALSWSGTKKIYVCDIESKKAINLSGQIPGSESVKFKEMPEKLEGSDIFINATPIGMKPGDHTVIGKNLLRKDLFVYDVIYNRKTELLRAAEKAGLSSCGGEGMLLFQGALSFELWTGIKAPVETMKQALAEALKIIKRR